MPAAPVAIMAGGIPFNLIGMTLVPPGSVVDKFQDAMVLAREKLAQSYAILSSGRSLTHLQAFVLEYSFNIKLGTQAPVAMTTICNGLKATLDGLRTDGLNICEPDPAIMAQHPGAEGYVMRIPGLGAYFRGDIHTQFDLGLPRTAHNMIHEATHKFWGTLDKGYIGNSIQNWLQVRIAHDLDGASPMPKKATDLASPNALVNADSYATLAMNV